MVFAVDAERVEQGFHIDRQGELVVLFEDVLDQRITFPSAAGIEFQQAVATGVQLLLQALALGTRFVDQGLPLAVVGSFQQGQQAWAELMLQGVAGRASVEEGIERFVVPLNRRSCGLVSR